MSDRNQEGLIREVTRDSGYRKAAKFLILLGEEEAARVLKHLSEEEIEGVTREIADIRTVDSREANKILQEFGYLVRSRSLMARGGLERAREMLEAAFGREKGEIAYQRLLEKTDYHPFSFVDSLDDAQISGMLRDESPPVVALVLSYLDPAAAAKAVAGLPVDMQTTVIRRIGRMEKVSPEIVRQAEEAFRNKIKRQGEIRSMEVDGRGRLVDILKYLDVGTETRLLDDLGDVDPELAKSMKEKLFDFHMMYRIRDRDMQRILRDFTDREIALMLKGKPDSLKDRVFAGLSSRRQELVSAEYEELGEVPRADVDKVTLEFMNYLRQQAEMGEILLAEDVDQWVE